MTDTLAIIAAQSGVVSLFYCAYFALSDKRSAYFSALMFRDRTCAYDTFMCAALWCFSLLPLAGIAGAIHLVSNLNMQHS
jgi:hypothetical protein